jgi:adenylate cyclase
VAGGLVVAGVALFGALGGLVLVILALGSVLGGSWTLFAQSRLLVDGGFAALATVMLYGVLTVAGYVRERRQRQQVRDAFAQYLSPALVKRLADNPGALRIGGEMKTMTMLFCDIRGFTGIAERLSHDPEGLTKLINLYFTAMSDRLLEYGATIDKYMGDAVMAFWNAPLDDADHARNACRAALEMLDGLAKLNRKLAASAIAIDIGIGLNSGECLVGNIGSEHRFNYSVIGDPVNLAARLEAETKVYGVRIAVGEATRALAPDFAYLELGIMRARGRAETTTIHALIGRAALTGEAAFLDLRRAQAAFLACYRGRDWAAARDALAAVRAAGADVGRGALDIGRLCDLYAARLDGLQAEPPGEGWDGVFAGT